MKHITGTFTKYSSLNFLRNQQRFALEDHIMNFHLDGGYKCYADDVKLCQEMEILEKILQAYHNIDAVYILNNDDSLPKSLFSDYYHNLNI